MEDKLLRYRMKYYYFISYAFGEEYSSGIGYGNIYIDTCRKIRTYDDGKLVVNEIKKSGVDNITILSIVLLDSEQEEY